MRGRLLARIMLSDVLKDMGVVGAGGGGFPTHVKASSRVESVIANGAECEPLIHKDYEIMCRYPREIVAGLSLMIDATGASHGLFGMKEKNRAAVEAIAPEAASRGVRMVLLGDFYPAGDEYELVHAATGRLIPAGGIPLHVGCVVNNVETLYNVQQAAHDVPVTRKCLTVTGAVRDPQTLWAPIGISFRDLIAHCGGAAVADFGLLVNGAMMGTLSFDLDDVVTRTTAGLILLPRQHDLITRKERPAWAMDRIGRSACDQCSYCTELCPRYLLGYDVQPHKVMRSLGFTLAGASNWNQWAELCCACGICTLYACPEALYPKEACDNAKASLRSEGITVKQDKPVVVHPMKEYRRVPLSMLRKRLGLDTWERDTPFRDAEPEPKKVRVKLKQHAGVPVTPAVRVGDAVRRGQPLGRTGDRELGAAIHASVDGTVRDITKDAIEIWR
jgi:Na+-translocating ferredoxin:NAD+ oxidoreductase RnfC subunit